LSFLPDEQDGYLNALQEYGFCIVKVLNEEECDEAVKELFQEANKNPSQKMKVILSLGCADEVCADCTGQPNELGE